MPATVLDTPFDPLQVLHQHEQTLDAGGYGAAAHFIGTMRNHNEGVSVSSLTLEHYPAMTAKELAKIIDDAHTKWKLIDALIVHRVGTMTPGDPIVLTAVWSAHRADAFEACRYLMEELKSRAPFWKKETLADGVDRWVEKNTSGYT
ncbi:MAG: molybdenum cofactor biosynthesis protein MoaE [Granulosicoccaceae bacterium]